jgi:hypothetical protein
MAGERQQRVKRALWVGRFGGPLALLKATPERRVTGGRAMLETHRQPERKPAIQPWCEAHAQVVEWDFLPAVGHGDGSHSTTDKEPWNAEHRNAKRSGGTRAPVSKGIHAAFRAYHSTQNST